MTDLQEKNGEFEKIDIENRKLQDSVSTKENELSALEKGTYIYVLYLYGYIRVCVNMSNYIHICTYIHIYLYKYVYIYIYVYLYI
jgi:hypothetical protein